MIHEDLPTLTETAFGSHPCCVVSVTYVRAHCFHGGNTGSNPVGDANNPKDLLTAPIFAGDTAGTHKFQPDFSSFFFASRSIATILPCAFRLAGVTAWA